MTMERFLIMVYFLDTDLHLLYKEKFINNAIIYAVINKTNMYLMR